MLLFIIIGPVRKVPAGKNSVPPPLPARLSIRWLMIAVHLTCPVGSAPWAEILVQAVCASALIRNDARVSINKNLFIGSPLDY
jgi:hypothetical protein